MSILNADITSERYILAGLCRYGSDAYWDVADILTERSFTNESNKLIFQCIKKAIETDDKVQIDAGLILKISHELGISYILSRKEELNHLSAILDFPTELSNVRKFAAKIRKLEIARLIDFQLEESQKEVRNVKGDESISSILGIAENKILQLNNLINDNKEEPQKVGENIEDYVKALEEHPSDMVGLPSGLPNFDRAIGSGLRPGVTLIAARIKSGKSMLADTIGKYLSEIHEVPVLYVDTEMTIETHWARLLSSMSRVLLDDIENGQFSKDALNRQKVATAVTKLKSLPFFHKNVSGKEFEEHIAIIRRWLMKDVGLVNGKAKPCLVIYDYLKLLNAADISNNFSEYQVLGLAISALYNLAIQYNFPILLFTQLNRQGIDQISTDTISGSDRLVWIANSMSILKRKDAEEIAEDGVKAGNMKLIPIVSRFGACLDYGDYINCHFEGQFATIKEGKTKSQLLTQTHDQDDGFIVENPPSDIPFDN